MHPVLKLLTQRIALGLVLMLAASVMIFAGTQILPGDVAQSILGQSATPQSLANLRAELGLNDPAWLRYFRWLGAALQGDLGTALTNKQDIATSMGLRLGNTLFLAFWAALISVPTAILLGLIAVRYQGRWPDKLISGVTLATVSVPEFLLGYIVMFYLAVKFRAFPSVATVYDSMSLGEKLNAIAPVVNVVMINLAYLVVGVVVVEVVFVYPGMGQYLVDHVSKRDVPVVQACGLVFAAVYIGLNMLADVISILANPRLRHPK